MECPNCGEKTWLGGASGFCTSCGYVIRKWQIVLGSLLAFVLFILVAYMGIL